MKRKYGVAFVVIGLCALLVFGLKPVATGNVPPRENGGAGAPYARAYSLTMARAELLALMLRLDLPQQTAVATEQRARSSCYVKVIVTAPKKVHDAIAPLVRLLETESAIKRRARAEAVANEMRRAVLNAEGVDDSHRD